MNHSLLAAALLSALATLPGCAKEITCPSGETLCNGACIDLAVDPANCGACGGACNAGDSCRTGLCVALATDRLNCGAVGRACLPGESCLSGACTSLQVACFSVNEVRAVEPLDLASGSPPRQAGVGPIALATLGADVWSVASLSGSLSRLPRDLAVAPTEYLLHGNDFEYLTVRSGRLIISNSGAGTVVVVDPNTGAVLDEVPVGASAAENLRGISFATGGSGEKAYASLYGDSSSGNPALGQRVAVLDAARLAGCGLAANPGHCLTVSGSIDLSAGADAPGLAFPGRSVAAGGKIYVTLANLKRGSSGYYTDPAGPGRLAQIDPADDSVGFLSLGAACGNPGGLALRGTSLWVACGTGGLVAVDLSGATPVAGALQATPPFFVPGNVAFCGDHGFVTDQYSGDIYPFDPVNYAASPAVATSICPASAGAYGYAWASDVACAVRP
jgi:YVTN family beta-propeller protein